MPSSSPNSGPVSSRSRHSSTPQLGTMGSSRDRSGSMNGAKATSMAVVWVVGLMCGVGLSSLGSMKEDQRSLSESVVVVPVADTAKGAAPQYAPASVSTVLYATDDSKCTKPKAPRFVSAFMRHWGLAAGHNPNWALTPPGGVVIDVGANDGSDYAIPAVKDGRKVVFSFEPVPSALNRLLANAQNAKIPMTHITPTPGQPFDMDIIRSTPIDRSQGHLFLIQAGAANETGKSSMVLAPADQMSYVESKGVQLDFTNGARRIDVALLRIDEVVPTDVFGEVYLFKSDAQGYDLNVFLGAEGLFRDGRVEFATTEFTPKVMEAFREGSSIELLDFLYRYNFLCFDWAAQQHIPRDRPGAFEPYFASFFERCADDKGCACQDEHCFRNSLGKWEELLCVGLNGGARDQTQRLAAQA